MTQDLEVSGDHWSESVNFSDFQLPGGLAGYRRGIVITVQAGPIYLCLQYTVYTISIPPYLEFFFKILCAI